MTEAGSAADPQAPTGAPACRVRSRVRARQRGGMAGSRLLTCRAQLRGRTSSLGLRVTSAAGGGGRCHVLWLWWVPRAAQSASFSHQGSHRGLGWLLVWFLGSSGAGRRAYGRTQGSVNTNMCATKAGKICRRSRASVLAADLVSCEICCLCAGQVSVTWTL